MKPKRKRPEGGAAFVMGDGDRFHGILCSRPVRFDDETKAEMILTFFVIRRANGTFTICNVNRTYDAKGNCVTRGVQGKEDIPADRIEQELRGIRETFSKGVEKGSGRKLEWDWLDLSEVTGMAEQVVHIKAWGRVTSSKSGPTRPLRRIPRSALRWTFVAHRTSSMAAWPGRDGPP